MGAKNFSWLLSICVLSAMGCHSDSRSGVQTQAPVPTIGFEAIASVSPLPGAANISLDEVVDVFFQVPMDPTTITPATLALFHGSNQIAGTVTANEFSATFTPATPLASGVPMKAVLGGGVLTATGEVLDPEFSWTFSTVDLVPIQVTSHYPAAGQTLLPLVLQISVEFSEDIDPASLTASSFQLAGPLGPIDGVVGLAGPRTLSFAPLAAFEEYSFYTATIQGIADFSGNAISPAYVFSFQTIDPTPPTIVETSPAATSPIVESVSIDAVVSVLFSEPMDALSVSPATLTLTDVALGAPVLGVVGLDPFDSRTLTFVPSAPLTPGRIFFAVVSGTITDIAGNPLGADFVWSFKTIANQFGEFAFVEQDDFGNAETPHVVLNPVTGEALAVWRQQVDAFFPPYSVAGGRFEPATLTWDAPVYFDVTFADDTSAPMLAWDFAAGNAVAVWAQRIGTDSFPRVYAVPYDPASKAWDPASILAISADTGTATNPSIAFDSASGSFHVVWQQVEAGGPTSQVLASQLNPASWGTVPAPIVLDSASASAGYHAGLSLAIDAASGRGYAMWAALDGPGFFNLYARALTNGVWDGAFVLVESEPNAGNNTNNLGQPAIAVDPLTKDALLVWRQKPGALTGAGAYRAFFQRLRYDPMLTAYSFPGCPDPAIPCAIQLDQDATNAVADPQIAVDPSGRALAIWTQAVPLTSATMPGDGLSSLYSVAFEPGSSVPGPIQQAENQTSLPVSLPQVVPFDASLSRFALVFVEGTYSGPGTLSVVKLNTFDWGVGWSNDLKPLEPPPPMGVGSRASKPSLTSDLAGLGMALWGKRLDAEVQNVVSNRFP